MATENKKRPKVASDPINVPLLLRERDPFGSLLISFLTKAEGGMSAVFPSFSEDKGALDVCMTLNGIEVPPEAIKEIFFRYSEYHANKLIKEAIRVRTEEVSGRMAALKDAMRDAEQVIRAEFGLEPYWSDE